MTSHVQQRCFKPTTSILNLLSTCIRRKYCRSTPTDPRTTPPTLLQRLRFRTPQSLARHAARISNRPLLRHLLLTHPSLTCLLSRYIHAPLPLGYVPGYLPVDELILQTATCDRNILLIRSVFHSNPSVLIGAGGHALAYQAGADVYRVFLRQEPALLQTTLSLAWTLLQWSVMMRNVDTVRMLLEEFGVDPNETFPWMDPVPRAVDREEGSREDLVITNLLLVHGAKGLEEARRERERIAEEARARMEQGG